ncbi:MAG: YjbQ family protein [candidate division Zixibacteria bacterium]|nr:YjbQ family protein [candidate division Zixibacteria bacterium]
MIKLDIRTRNRQEFVDVTERVQRAVTDSGFESGVVTCFVPHTTAAVTINEHADPDVVTDMISALSTVFPERGDYRHVEGNSDAHIKSSLIGCSVQVLVEQGRLVLGRWQGIFFCEFDGPRSRTLIVKVARDA